MATIRIYEERSGNRYDRPEFWIFTVSCGECDTAEVYHEPEMIETVGSCTDDDLIARFVSAHPACKDGTCVAVDCADLLNDARGG